MKDIAHCEPPYDIRPTSSHFDYLEALQSEEYYNKGILLRINFEKENEEFPLQVFSQLMNRLVLRTDSSTLTISCPLFSIEIPKGNSKFATIRDLLLSIKYSIDDMPSSIKGHLLPKIGVFSEIVTNEEYVPDWFKLEIQDPLGNSRIQCNRMDNVSTITTLKECYDREPNIQVDFFTRTQAECIEFDLDFERPHN